MSNELTWTFKDSFTIIIFILIGVGIGYTIWGHQDEIVYPGEPSIVEEYAMTDGSLKLENDGKEIVFYSKVQRKPLTTEEQILKELKEIKKLLKQLTEAKPDTFYRINADTLEFIGPIRKVTPLREFIAPSDFPILRNPYPPDTLLYDPKIDFNGDIPDSVWGYIKVPNIPNLEKIYQMFKERYDREQNRIFLEILKLHNDSYKFQDYIEEGWK